MGSLPEDLYKKEKEKKRIEKLNLGGTSSNE
jgi:hypothetical protein